MENIKRFDMTRKAIIKSTIYKVTSPSGKVYIGQTTAKWLSNRKRAHIHAAKNEKSRLYDSKFSSITLFKCYSQWWFFWTRLS